MSEAGTPAAGGIVIAPAREGDEEALEELQRECFPTLGVAELMRAEHFRHHREIFPEADLVARMDGAVVGLGSGFLIDFDFEAPGHTFREIIDDGWYGHHDPQGDWYYGADISVHPRLRGRGIGGMLYEARKELVRRLGRRGIVAGGMLPGYDRHRDRMTVPEYVRAVVAGAVRDPTLTFQLRHGFRVVGLLEGYLEDTASDDWATLITWEASTSARGTLDEADERH